MKIEQKSGAFAAHYRFRKFVFRQRGSVRVCPILAKSSKVSCKESDDFYSSW